MWTEILAAIAGAGAGQLISFGVRKRNQRTQAIDEWYEETLSQISLGHGICLSARKRSNLNYGSISGESGKVSQRLMDQVNPYPKGVDQVSVAQVHNLAKIFRKMSAVTEASEDQSTLESIKEIFEMGQREYSNVDDPDMSEAINTSAEYSPIVDDIFREMDISPRLFGSQFGEKFDNAESFEQLLVDMNSEIGGNRKFIEKTLESHLISDEWDESLSLGIRVHLQIASNLCKEAINHISETSNMKSAN